MRILLVCSICIGVIPFGGAWADPPQEEKPLSEAMLSLQDIDPSAGSELSDETVVRAVVQYQIEPFYSDDGLYTAGLQFDLQTPGHSVSVQSEKTFRNRVFLEEGSGTFLVEYPVEYVLRRHDLAAPITVRATVHQTTGEKTTKIIGTSQAVVYSVGE